MFKKCLNIHYIYDKTNARDGRKRVLEQAGGAEQRITEAAPDELKCGEVGNVMRTGHRQGGGVGRCSSGVV